MFMIYLVCKAILLVTITVICYMQGVIIMVSVVSGYQQNLILPTTFGWVQPAIQVFDIHVALI